MKKIFSLVFIGLALVLLTNGPIAQTGGADVVYQHPSGTIIIASPGQQVIIEQGARVTWNTYLSGSFEDAIPTQSCRCGDNRKLVGKCVNRAMVFCNCSDECIMCQGDTECGKGDMKDDEVSIISGGAVLTNN